jgi:hypothetical protein
MKMEMLDTLELTYTQRLASGPVVHVDCHASMDQVQIVDVAWLTVAGGRGRRLPAIRRSRVCAEALVGCAMPKQT